MNQRTDQKTDGYTLLKARKSLFHRYSEGSECADFKSGLNKAGYTTRHKLRRLGRGSIAIFSLLKKSGDRWTDRQTGRPTGGGRGAHSFAPLAPQQSVPLCFAPLYSYPLHAALQFNLSKINAFGLGGLSFVRQSVRSSVRPSIRLPRQA